MDADLFDKGKAMREAVLGQEYVERAMNADEFNRPFQELVTEYCWGAIWTRPGLSPKTRSMLNLAMLTALNRSHELKLHIRGALSNGVSRDEIREVLMQAAVYCGIPAGVEAFRCAREVFAEAES
jgi:4-carboxymuconolactone decarboxylase